MKINKTKAIVLATLASGTVVGIGCLGGGIWRQVLLGAAVQQAGEFVLDNNAVFDLFPDGGATTTTAQ